MTSIYNIMLDGIQAINDYDISKYNDIRDQLNSQLKSILGDQPYIDENSKISDEDKVKAAEIELSVATVDAHIAF